MGRRVGGSAHRLGGLPQLPVSPGAHRDTTPLRPHSHVPHAPGSHAPSTPSRARAHAHRCSHTEHLSQAATPSGALPGRAPGPSHGRLEAHRQALVPLLLPGQRYGGWAPPATRPEVLAGATPPALPEALGVRVAPASLSRHLRRPSWDRPTREVSRAAWTRHVALCASRAVPPQGTTPAPRARERAAQDPSVPIAMDEARPISQVSPQTFPPRDSRPPGAHLLSGALHCSAPLAPGQAPAPPTD